MSFMPLSPRVSYFSTNINYVLMLFQDITKRGANALDNLAKQQEEQKMRAEQARQQKEAERQRKEEEERRNKMTTITTTTTTTTSKLTTLPPEVRKTIDDILSSLQKIPKDKIPTNPPHPTLSLILDIEPTKADDIYAYMNKESIKIINNEISNLISANENIDTNLKKQLEFLTNHLKRLIYVIYLKYWNSLSLIINCFFRKLRFLINYFIIKCHMWRAQVPPTVKSKSRKAISLKYLESLLAKGVSGCRLQKLISSVTLIRFSCCFLL